MVFSTHNAITDIFNLENIVQQSGMVYTKTVLIDTLRDIFSQDRHFKYVSDVFGFPKTPSHLGLDSDAGVLDEETTRIFIGSSYRYDIKFNPSIVVRNVSSKYVPISFNQNFMGVIYKQEVLTDGYGNTTILNVPAYHMRVGAWDQSCEVRIITESEIDREEITDIVQVALIGSRRQELQNAGVFVKELNVSGLSEVQYMNDFLYVANVNLDIRTEWRIHIPISNVVERIGMCIAFKTLDGEDSDILSINQQFSHSDLL